jgi:hypothetical protein
MKALIVFRDDGRLFVDIVSLKLYLKKSLFYLFFVFYVSIYFHYCII